MKNLGIEHLAMVAVAFSGLAWGVFWIPLRALDAAGISGLWAVVMFQALPTALLAPAILVRWRRIVSGGWTLHVSGLLAGSALVLYAGALVFTDVVRALLFFYLTPLWSTLLARVVLGEPITGVRWGTIGLALAGLLLILKVDTGFSGTLGPGDWMGLASGVVWAFAAVSMRSDTKGSGIEFTLSYFVWGSIAALLLTLLSSQGTDPPGWDVVRNTLWWMVPVAALLLIPPALAVMWGATLLSPGLLSILFMTEISAGTVTAALWANEPFGTREVAGIILITLAGVLEPISLLRGRSPA